MGCRVPQTDMQGQIFALAQSYGAQFRGLRRQLTQARPHICPFDDIVAGVDAGRTVLDIGCGGGFLIYLLARTKGFAEGVGVDADPAAIHAGTAALAATGTSGFQLQACADPAQWPAQEFDLVTMIDVLHHIPREAQAGFFAAACARVKPGGVLLFKDIQGANPGFAFANRLHDLLMARQWVEYAPVETVRSVAETCGLTVTAHKLRAMYWYGHEQIVFRRPLSPGRAA
jgi:2-polyprenyl-3-methyl-5-hydroxy-6-metoxy-1,4-benzoquinol methylase